jgi:hypothetical protein
VRLVHFVEVLARPPHQRLPLQPSPVLRLLLSRSNGCISYSIRTTGSTRLKGHLRNLRSGCIRSSSHPAIFPSRRAYRESLGACTVG